MTLYARGLRATHHGLLALLLIAFGMALAGAQAEAIVEHPLDQAMLTQVTGDLAGRLGIAPDEITLVEAKAVIWPDGALGMPEHDHVYAAVLTPGWLITLKARDIPYVYTASATAFRYGGPVSSWGSSILYLKPGYGDPNMNGTLYQASLLGTNSACLLTEVSDFYPQANGHILAKRRTSRSGHDLLYLNVKEPEKPVLLQSAMDFGHASFTEDGNRWAAFTRPRVGAAWTVTVGGVGDAGIETLTLPLPDGINQGAVHLGGIAWTEGGQLQVELITGSLTDSMTNRAAFEIDPRAEPPAWKTIPWYTFVGSPDYMLNKSEHLEVEEVTRDGKPVIEVARVWFTGDRNVLATISGESFTYQGWELLGRHAIIHGTRNDGREKVVFAADIGTGDVLESVYPGATSTKPLAYPPYSTPFALPSE